MSDSSRSRTLSTKSTASSKALNRYRLYVCCITAFATIALALLIWPLSVKHFESTSRIQLNIAPSAIDDKSGDQIIAMAIVRNTTDERLIKLLSGTRGSTQVKSEVLDEANLDQIRDSIRVGTRPGRKTNDVEVQISILGEGTPDEIEFLNRLANSVATDVTSLPATKEIENYIANWKLKFQEQLLVDNREFNDAASLVQKQLNEAARKRNEFLSSSPTSAMVESTDDYANQQIRERIAQLEQQIQRLKSVNGWDDSHPEIASTRQAIEQLGFQISKTFQTGNTSRIPNPFQNASSSSADWNNSNSESVYGMEQAETLAEIDTSIALLDQLNQDLFQSNTDKMAAIESLQMQLPTAIQKLDLVSLEKLELAERSEPIGGTPNSKQFLLILLFAGGLGSVMAWQVTPEMRRHGFRSAEHAETVLGIPSVGVLNADETISPAAKQHSGLIRTLVKSCEYLLLFLLITLVIAMLVNSDIFGSFLSNPMEVISRLIWTITPR